MPGDSIKKCAVKVHSKKPKSSQELQFSKNSTQQKKVNTSKINNHPERVHPKNIQNLLDDRINARPKKIDDKYKA